MNTYSPSLQLFFSFAAASDSKWPYENPRLLNRIEQRFGEQGLVLYRSFRRQACTQTEAFKRVVTAFREKVPDDVNRQPP